MKFFRRYLTKDDKERIEKDYTKKGEIILERFEKTYEKYKDNPHFALIKRLIKNCSDLLDRGNYSAHSLTLDNYQERIKKFRKENKIKFLDPEIFCFCINLGLNKTLLKDAYYLFQTHFTKSLIIKKEKIKSFESYFRN